MSFFDGLLCMGTDVKRIDVQQNPQPGSVVYGPGLIQANGWVMGQTKYFQSFYRDQTGPCGSGANLSAALEVTFMP